jgi:hypothetical protein
MTAEPAAMDHQTKAAILAMAAALAEGRAQTTSTSRTEALAADIMV